MLELKKKCLKSRKSKKLSLQSKTNYPQNQVLTDIISYKPWFCTFLQVPELNECEQKKEAFLQYKAFSKVIKEYEDGKFKEWVSGASSFVDNMMKKNILHVVFKKEDDGK